jgi:hypothetical protein
MKLTRRVGEFSLYDRSMDNHILKRVNSYIKVRKERTEACAIILIVLLHNR